jgi:hypothetical protein
LTVKGLISTCLLDGPQRPSIPSLHARDSNSNLDRVATGMKRKRKAERVHASFRFPYNNLRRSPQRINKTFKDLEV